MAKRSDLLERVFGEKTTKLAEEKVECMFFKYKDSSEEPKSNPTELQHVQFSNLDQANKIKVEDTNSLAY